MYEKDCSNPKCKRGKDGGRAKVYTFANSRTGTTPISYCSEFCKKETSYDSRFSKWTKK